LRLPFRTFNIALWGRHYVVVATEWQPFLCLPQCYNLIMPSVMQQTIQLSRDARRSAAPEVINLVRRAAARLFSEKACAVILAVLTLSAVAIDIAVADTLRAQRLVGLCALAAMPWIGAMLTRFSHDEEKGGRK
jgi:hypothetical protein